MRADCERFTCHRPVSRIFRRTLANILWSRAALWREIWINREAMELFRDSGIRIMARLHWRNGLSEFRRSLRKRDFVHSCQRLVPEVRMEDMTPGGSGVRAQAVGPDGSLLDDFRILTRERYLHVL